MLKDVIAKFAHQLPAEEASAHCDGPCGVYDPSSARIAAEAAVSMTKKILALTPPADGDAQAWAKLNCLFYGQITSNLYI